MTRVRSHVCFPVAFLEQSPTVNRPTITISRPSVLPQVLPAPVTITELPPAPEPQPSPEAPQPAAPEPAALQPAAPQPLPLHTVDQPKVLEAGFGKHQALLPSCLQITGTCFGGEGGMDGRCGGVWITFWRECLRKSVHMPCLHL